MNIYVSKNASLIQLTTLYTSNFSRLYWGHLNLLFSCLHRPFFLKIKFKGKGYYIYKNKRNTITPQFGYSHRLYLYAYFVSVKFLSKTSIFLFGLLKSDVIKVGLGIKAMRPINIFTGRGVRFSKQIIYKKVGKVSSYR
jgi:ribosomal protein L6P/L9E